MLFVSITEYGTTDTAFKKLLDDLNDRADRLGKSFAFAHDLVVTFGTTDLVEIDRFDHYFHFAEMGSSSAQDYRRCVGAYCPPLPSGVRLDRSICTIDEVLREEGNGLRPLLAIMYLKLLPVPVLAMPARPDSPLTHRLYERLCAGDLSLWEKSRAILRCSIGKDAERYSRELRVTALIGLDAVEIILIVRAVCLEQISALAWAIRDQKLADFWSHESYPETATNMLELLQAGSEESHVDKALLPAHWNTSPLFAGTTSVIGMPLRKKRGSRKWGFEALADTDHEAARAALFTVRTSFMPGKFVQSIEPFRLSQVAGQDEAAGAGSGHEDPTEDATVSEEDPVFLMLFDRADNLVLPEPVNDLRVPNDLIRKRFVRELRQHIIENSGFELHDTAKEGIRTYTEIAVRVRIPGGIASDTSNDLLLKLFNERLRKQREVHFQRAVKYSHSWTRRWLEAATRRGIVYSATNKVVKMISTVLGHLDIDLEGFVDLLPVLDHFMDAVQLRETTPEDVIWFLWVLEHVTTTRCRQDHPLRAPHVSLAIEGNAGYRLARDAFIHFAESVCAVVDPNALLVVRDSSNGGTSCSLGPARWDILRVSTLTLHHPVHWLIAPALTHGRLEHTTLADLEREAFAAAGSLHSAFKEMELEVLPQESLARLAERTRAFLRQESGDNKLATFFLDTLGHAVGTLVADLCLLRSLRLPDHSAARTRKLFWFLHGPALVFFIQYRYGFKTPEPGIIQSLIVRCILVSHVLDPGPGGWFGALKAALKQLRKDAPSMILDGPSLSPQSALSARLQCIKEDLRVPDATWIAAIDLLRESLAHVRGQAPRVRRIMGEWIAFSKAAQESLFQFSGHDDHPCSLYAEYISGLVDLWGEEADPWLPFTASHSKVKILVPTFRLANAPYGPSLLRRGGILVQKSSQDQEGHREYRRRTYDFMAKLGESARHSRCRKVLGYLGSSSVEGAIS